MATLVRLRGERGAAWKVSWPLDASCGWCASRGARCLHVCSSRSLGGPGQHKTGALESGFGSTGKAGGTRGGAMSCSVESSLAAGRMRQIVAAT